MSKIIYVCYRNTTIGPEIENKIQEICDDLNPDNISSEPTLIYRENHIIYGVNNPTSTIRTRGLNVLLGKVFGDESDWDKVNTDPPDGNYAIFRSAENVLEVMTDCLGTRSIWYYFDEHVFIASTSQKAIIKYLGDFIFDEGMIPWMLSTGSIGPSHCWDKRLKKVPGDGAVTVNKSEWILERRSGTVKFVPAGIPKKESKELLRKTLLEVFRSIDLNMEKWAVTLSGGHDSRAILFLLQKSRTHQSRVRTLTWGEEKSLQDSGSDACIAEEIAKVLETNHQFFPTEPTEEPIETIVNRFLRNGEGRVDHLPAYLDGFDLWKKIYEADIEGVIRGDEIFGYNHIYSPLVVKSFMGLTLCSEYSNLRKYDYINSLSQELPEALKQKKNESLSTWRDRTFQLYRIPYVQSALADLKYPYVEQINPFLSKKIVNIIRTMPDQLRTKKKLFKQVMKRWDLGVPFAKRASTIKFNDVLKEDAFVQLIKKELTSDYAREIFPENFLNKVVENVKTREKNKAIRKRSFLARMKSMVPENVKTYIAQQKPSLQLDENILAFRIFIICRMHRELST